MPTTLVVAVLMSIDLTKFSRTSQPAPRETAQPGPVTQASPPPPRRRRPHPAHRARRATGIAAATAIVGLTGTMAISAHLASADAAADVTESSTTTTAPVAT